MFLGVRFQGEERLSLLFSQALKESWKIDVALSYREVGIPGAVIVVQMQLHETVPQGLHPLGQRGLGKTVLMSDVQAEAKMPGMKMPTRFLVQQGIELPNIFHEQDDIQLLSLGKKLFPDNQAPLQPLVAEASMVVGIVACVANHLDGLKDVEEIHTLLQSVLGNLPDEGIDASQTQIQERTMECHPNPVFVQLVCQGLQPRARDFIQLARLKNNFKVHAMAQDHFHVTIQNPARDADVHLLEKAQHIVIELKLPCSHFGIPTPTLVKLKIFLITMTSALLRK
jgi:hypothetical protein